MITKIVNSKSFLQQTIGIGTGSQSFRERFPLLAMTPVMNTQTGKQVDYVEAFVKITGTMPAGSTITADFYKGGVKMASSTSGALGPFTNTSFTQRFACLDIFDEVEITANCKQTTSPYTVDIIFSCREKVLNDHYVDSPISNVVFALGPSVAGGGNIDNTITFLDSQGVPVTERVNGIVYLSSDANGETPTAVDTTFSALAGQLLQQLTALQMYIGQSTASGVLQLRLNNTAAKTVYINVLANGKKWTSGAVVWS